MKGRRGPAWLREIVAACVRYSGLPWLIRHVVAAGKVTIILYHDPAPTVFEAHMAYLSRRYQFIRIGDLVKAIETGDWSRLPRRALLVTFDDGHKGNFDLLPIFRKYGVWPTIYLVSGVIGTDRHFWFKHVGGISNELKHLRNQERLELLKRQYGYTPTTEYPGDRHALTAAAIEQMKDAVDFEPHTCFHPVLPTCDDEECRREIVESKRQIEELIGRPCRSFTYPNGDYGPREARFAREAGFVCARTLDVGWNGPERDPYLLRITGVTDDASVNVLATQLTGLTMYLRYRIRGGRGGLYPQTPVERKGS
jgi:peptidoglycan/xylan/chitin deacetylase (PgdA/CDA1 family)